MSKTIIINKDNNKILENEITKYSIYTKKRLFNELNDELSNIKSDLYIQDDDNDDNDNINDDDDNNEINIIATNSIGSNTAKNGYNEEEYLVKKLNEDIKLQILLEKFTGKKIINNACRIKGNKKSDICISNINIQHKKTKKNQFGQIDRHYVDNLIEKIPELNNYKYIFKNLCELPLDPITKLCNKNYSIKKINNINYTENEINNFINIIEKNKKKIINYAFCGYETNFIPELFSISLFKKDEREKIIFWKMNDIIDYLMNSNVIIKKSQTVIEISNNLTFQRKGGDGGKKEGNNFQFKFIPSNLPLDKALIYEL